MGIMTHTGGGSAPLGPIRATMSPGSAAPQMFLSSVLGGPEPSPRTRTHTLCHCMERTGTVLRMDLKTMGPGGFPLAGPWLSASPAGQPGRVLSSTSCQGLKLCTKEATFWEAREVRPTASHQSIL